MFTQILQNGTEYVSTLKWQITRGSKKVHEACYLDMIQWILNMDSITPYTRNKLVSYTVPMITETPITLWDEFFYPLSTEVSVLFFQPSFHCYFQIIISFGLPEVSLCFSAEATFKRATYLKLMIMWKKQWNEWKNGTMTSTDRG